MKRLFALGLSLVLAAAAHAQPATDSATPVGRPVITFDSTTYQFGKITQGDPVLHDFVVSNAGDATLNILDVHPSCGCTTAGVWPHELAPGKSGIIPIQINSKNLNGSIKKTVTITSNDKLHPSSVFQLIGTVTKPIDVTPLYATFHMISGDSNPPPVTVKIFNRTGKPMNLSAPSGDTGAFTVNNIKTISDGSEYEVTVTANPPYLHGTNSTLLLETGWSNYTVRIPAYLTVASAINYQPHAINVPQNVPRDTTIKVSLYSIRPQDTFSDPEVSDSRISVSLTNSSASGRPVYQLAAIVPAGYRATPGKPAHVTVKTSDPHSPVVTIPVVQMNFNNGLQPWAAAHARLPLPAISSSSAAATASPATAPSASTAAH